MHIQLSHANFILSNFFEIQFDPARLISRAFNSTLLV